MCTILDNVSTLITFKASNTRAISCYTSFFLTLETVVFIEHHVNWEGVITVAVSCYTALSFSTSEIASVGVCGPFS